MQRFVELVATLRGECPWDRKQTHQSLRRHLLEESYEVLEAIDELDVDAGVGLRATSRRSWATCSSRSCSTPGSPPRRASSPWPTSPEACTTSWWPATPTSSATSRSTGADDVVANWEQIKKAEKGRESVFDGIPAAMPALLFALKVQKKAATLELGVEDGDIGGAAVDADPMTTDQLGERLWDVVDRARRLGLDPEDALRKAASTHRDQLREAEQGE